MSTDQELFAAGLAIYQKIVRENLMFHREVYGKLHDILVREAPKQFRFLDVACGTASSSAAALIGTDIGRYIGIDISTQSLDVAKQALAMLPCPVELRCQNFADAIDQWSEPVDVVWVGMSLHHLPSAEKLPFMQRIRAILPRNGLFLIWEPTLLEDEDRAAWLDRFTAIRTEWSALTDEEFAAVDTHIRAADYPESKADWAALGNSAGFGRMEELYMMASRMGRVYKYN